MQINGKLWKWEGKRHTLQYFRVNKLNVKEVKIAQQVKCQRNTK